MYCPGCKVEFREGFTRCTECDLDIVEGHPPVLEPEYVDQVTVFEGDSNSAVVVYSALEDAGIRSWIEDEGLHSVYPSVGSNKVKVPIADEAAALEVIATAKAQEDLLTEDISEAEIEDTASADE